MVLSKENNFSFDFASTFQALGSDLSIEYRSVENISPPTLSQDGIYSPYERNVDSMNMSTKMLRCW